MKICINIIASVKKENSYLINRIELVIISKRS